MKYRSLLVWCLIICTVLGIISGGKVQAWAGEPEANLDPERFDISTAMGMGGYAKDANYIPVHLEITNHGDDFSGKIRIQAISDYSRVVAYTKSFCVSAGETKPVNMEIPNLPWGAFLDIFVMDDQDQIVYKKIIQAGLVYAQDIYVGILSDDFDGLSAFDGLPVYMSNSDQYRFSRIFPLSERNFPESANGLESLDMIVINHFDSSRLSEEQYSAIKSWVADGGVLLIGTGIHASETLSLFSDDYLVEDVGDLLPETLNFDLEGFEYVTRAEPMDYVQPVIKEIEQIQEAEDALYVSDSSTSLSSYYEYAGDTFSSVLANIMPVSINTLDLTISHAEDVPQVLCQTLTQGAGRIVVAKFDLGDKTFEAWPYHAAAMEHLLEVTGAGDTIMENIDIFGVEDSPWYVTSMLTNVLDGKLPKIGGYVILFFIYIVLVAPVAYLILKKTDRRHLLWVVIPVLAVSFTGIMFVFGNSTRQQNPFFNYGTMLKLHGKNVSESVCFSITSPRNKAYTFDVDGAYRLSYIDASFDFMKVSSDRDGYDIKISRDSNQNSVDVENVKAFDTQYFLARKTGEFSGSIHTELQYTPDGYVGQIKNDTDYKIKDAFLYMDHMLMYIGDIDAGQSVSVEDNGKVSENIMIYDIAETLYPEQYSAASNIDLAAIARKNMVQTYYNIYADHIYATSLAKSQPQILGFFEGYPVNISEKTDYEMSGVVMFSSDVAVTYTAKDGEIKIPDLSGYIEVFNGAIDFVDYTFMEDVLEVSYFLPEMIGQPVKIQMSDDAADALTIAFYNYAADQYDQVFMDSDELSGEALKNYIFDGQLRVRIEKVDKNLYNSTRLPVFSVTGRAQ